VQPVFFCVFEKKLFVVKVAIFHPYVFCVFLRFFVCSQSGNFSSMWTKVVINHPEEDFVNPGYEPDMKYKTLIILQYLWLHTQN
jgi:hypothetical protein